MICCELFIPLTNQGRYYFLIEGAEKEVEKEEFALLYLSENTKIDRELINIQGGLNDEYMA